MDIAILCVGALLATMAAWMYLNVQRPKVYDSEDATNIGEEPTEQAANNQEQNTINNLFIRPTKHRVVFLIVMLLSLCAISISLEMIFVSNTLLDNAKLLALLAILFVAANVDARHRIIPNVLVLTGLVLRIVFWCVELFTSPETFWGVVKNDLIACFLVVAFFVVGVLLVKGGIGMGDIKLMLVMCLFQGFYGVVSSLFCSLFVAFIYAIIVLLFKKKNKKDSVAFAPAILIGTVLSVFLTGM